MHFRVVHASDQMNKVKDVTQALFIILGKHTSYRGKDAKSRSESERSWGKPDPLKCGIEPKSLKMPSPYVI